MSLDDTGSFQENVLLCRWPLLCLLWPRKIKC